MAEQKPRDWSKQKFYKLYKLCPLKKKEEEKEKKEKKNKERVWSQTKDVQIQGLFWWCFYFYYKHVTLNLHVY